jgi:hypothetical protein
MRLPARGRVVLHYPETLRIAIEDPEIITLPRPGRRLLMRLSRGVHGGNRLPVLLGASLVIRLTEESHTSSFPDVLEGKPFSKNTN